MVKEKSLRICIANIKQWIKQEIVKAIKWVDTKIQIADVLTKENTLSELIKQIFSEGRFIRQLYDSLQNTELKIDTDTLLQLTFTCFAAMNEPGDKYQYELMHAWD